MIDQGTSGKCDAGSVGAQSTWMVQLPGRGEVEPRQSCLLAMGPGSMPQSLPGITTVSSQRESGVLYTCRFPHQPKECG